VSLRKIKEKAAGDVLADMVEENLALAKLQDESEGRVEIVARPDPVEGGPEQTKKILQSLHWDNIGPFLPGASSIEEAVNTTAMKISEGVKDGSINPLKAGKVLNNMFGHLTKMQGSMVAAIAKQLEKAPVVAIQNNVTTGGRVMNKPRPIQAPSKVLGSLRGPTSPVRFSDSKPDAKSNPDSASG